jgi:hypothetical protein
MDCERDCDCVGGWAVCGRLVRPLFSTARALVRAITELGWEEPEAEDVLGPILTLALFDLSTMGPAPAEGSREWLECRLLEEQSRALAQQLTAGSGGGSDRDTG